MENPSIEKAQSLYALPFLELVLQAAQVHRLHFNANEIQTSSLLSIKTGSCPEDCKYCPQSAHYNTELAKEKLLPLEPVIEQALAARAAGATRFCMGAAWRSPTERDMPAVLEMVKAVKALGMETCMTLGMLNDNQTQALADAGLDYYNHNVDTSKAYYANIITSRSYDDRLATLARVRAAGIKLCSGGILGLGETTTDRLTMLVELASLQPAPESVPLNLLVPVAGTPLAEQAPLDPFEFIRCIAVARILMPQSYLRLSAGRQALNDQAQALAFMAGANSIFYGDKLLTTANPDVAADAQLLARLGLRLAKGQAWHDAQQIPGDCPKIQVGYVGEGIEEPGASSLFYSAT